MVKDAGLGAVVGVLVEEILFRCDAPINVMPVDIALDVTHESERHRTVFRIVRDRPIAILDGEEPVIRRELRMNVVDLVRRLYGRADHPRTGDFHDAFFADPPRRPDRAAGDLRLDQPGIRRPAVRLHRSADRPRALSVAYGSEQWASFHWYTAHYEKEFAPYRDRPVRILEIGIGGFSVNWVGRR